MNNITVININSLSYTGTTWLNLVLGCHERAMALGPLDRLWQVLRKRLADHWRVSGQPKDTHCLVHGNACEFWPKFVKQYSVDENIFISLHKYTGKNIFTTNNIADDSLKSMLCNEKLNVKNIYLVRDGRQLVESYLRKNKNKSYLQGITEFLQTSFSNFYFDDKAKYVLNIRYEDLMQDPKKYLKIFSSFIEIDYSDAALCYWNYNHHLVGGNPGTIATLRLSEGLDITEFEGADFYKEQFDRLKQFGPQSFVYQRESSVASRMELFLFDCLAGADNARFGYDRDRFSERERWEFGEALRKIVVETNLPEYFVAQLRPNFSGTDASVDQDQAAVNRMSFWHRIGKRLDRSIIKRG